MGPLSRVLSPHRTPLSGTLPSELGRFSLPGLSAPPLQLRVCAAPPGPSLSQHVDFEMLLNHPSGDSLKCFLEASITTAQTSRIKVIQRLRCISYYIVYQVIALTFEI